MVRTILTWRVLGEDLVGTGHFPASDPPGSRAGPRPLGVLLLNPGSAPRSGNGDLSSRIGDRLALRGIPVIRFDFPGLGDSRGSTPADLTAYWDAVVDGRNDRATVELIERVQDEFGVAQVIVGGLCAAAVPAVRALGRSRADPAGLVLLEPNFRLFDGADAGLGRESRLERVTRPLRAYLGPLNRRLGPALPPDANRPLIERWQAGMARGLHTLVVVAAGQGMDRYVTRILDSMPARARALVACVRVPGTNHVFTAGGGREAVLAGLERWVSETFIGGTAMSARRGTGS